MPYSGYPSRRELLAQLTVARAEGQIWRRIAERYARELVALRGPGPAMQTDQGDRQEPDDQPPLENGHAVTTR